MIGENYLLAIILSFIGFSFFLQLTPIILQPHVDFGLKLLGADLMSIPGLYNFVQVKFLVHLITCIFMVLESIFPLPFLQDLIKDQVANMYLWPKTLDVQILDIAKYVS